MSEFEWCKEQFPAWRGLRVDHKHLRGELLREPKPPKSYLCPRCGVEVMNAGQSKAD